MHIDHFMICNFTIYLIYIILGISFYVSQPIDLISFYISLSMEIVLIISWCTITFYKYHARYFISCLLTYAFHQCMHLHLCILSYASHHICIYMHPILCYEIYTSLICFVYCFEHFNYC